MASLRASLPVRKSHSVRFSLSKHQLADVLRLLDDVAQESHRLSAMAFADRFRMELATAFVIGVAQSDGAVSEEKSLNVLLAEVRESLAQPANGSRIYA